MSEDDEEVALLGMKKRGAAPTATPSQGAEPTLHILANTGRPLGLVPEGPIESLECFRRMVRWFQQKGLHLPTGLYQFLGELWGTFILVFFIEMVGASSVFSGNLMGVWQVAIAEGLGVTIAIYMAAALSDAHLNPAVTCALALFRRSPHRWHRLLLYPLAQLLGAFSAAALSYGIWSPAIAYFEQQQNITRGQPGSELTASAFACYFPNPSWALPAATADAVTTVPMALLCELIATAILMFAIMTLTDHRNHNIVNPKITPVIIGLTVAVLISAFGSHTMAALNPARDFGPRLFTAIAGWGQIALPGPRNGFWVYIVGPILGALVGALLYEILFFFPHYVQPLKLRRPPPTLDLSDGPLDFE